MNYVPFLKYKVNEVSALSTLDDSEKKLITPFFDLPRTDVMNELSLKILIDKAYRKYELHLKKLPYFYIDNFDIDDRIKINGADNYAYLLETFSGSNLIPVIGIDRENGRNDVVIDSKKNGVIKSDSVALRLVSDDIISYALIEDEIEEIFNALGECFNKLHLIIDNRVCNNIDTDDSADLIIKFLKDITNNTQFERIVITGSSIPASIRDLLEPNSSLTIDRAELKIFSKVSDKLPSVIVGDYTTVSPLYSDTIIKRELMRRVTAPKIMYSYNMQMHIMRGGAIEGHIRGTKQYNDLSARLIKEVFFRGKDYSFGDKYLYEKAINVGSDATPSTIPKGLINAHMTYMLNDYL